MLGVGKNNRFGSFETLLCNLGLKRKLKLFLFLQ